MTPLGEAAPVRATLVDYGAGNLVSIRNALLAVGADVDVCRRPEDLVDAEMIILPGVGASGPAMARLRRQGLLRPLDSGMLTQLCLGALEASLHYSHNHPEEEVNTCVNRAMDCLLDGVGVRS